MTVNVFITSVDAGHLGMSLSEWYIEYTTWMGNGSLYTYITTVKVLVMKS